ncbi:MAG: CapA family protein [Hyphomicrobium sp.]
MLTIVLGGDTGLGGSNQPVRADGALRHGEMRSWPELTKGIAPLIDGDLNFANLETVVTDRNDLRANPKAFNFRSHPDGVRHLVDAGFNVFSTANNHASDYGETGLRETLRHLEGFKANGLRAWPGIGTGREQASRPSDISVKGYRVRLSAIGIGGHGVAGDDRTGMLAYNNPDDFRETVTRLAGADGDVRILSVHYGSELQVRPDQSDERKLRDEAAKAAGIDIVVGHHAHVPAGVQVIGGKVIFYGLGNMLHPGMQDMGRFNACRDYGLMARVHVARDDSGRAAVRAIEAIPLTDMHRSPSPLQGEAGRTRIDVINHLASGLDDAGAGATGVRFTGRFDGTGLHCLPGAEDLPGRIGFLCRDWQPPPEPPATVARRLASACGTPVFVARRSSAGSVAEAGAPPAAPRRKKVAGSSSGSFWNIFGAW